MRASTINRNPVVMLVAWMLAVASFEATACIPLQRTDLYVGNTSTDAQCNYGTIQDAIDAVECPETWIILTDEATYNDEHLTVNNRSFTLAGGHVAHCGDTPPVCDPTLGCGGGGPPGLTTISGHSGDSVIHFEGGADVFLYNLEITGGNAGSGGSGGGLFYEGTGNLYLNNVTIDNNEAGYGGGIDISPSGGQVTLTLQQNTLVIDNTADTSGGGIRIEGDSRLFALLPNTLIAFNQANGQSSDGYGGGIEVVNQAQADIGSSGYGDAGVVSNNFAEYGGGIAAVQNGDNHSGIPGLVRLFTTDPQHPVTIEDNGASHSGGGVFLKPSGTGANATAELCAQDFAIDTNQAVEGAAVYADEDADAFGDYEGTVIALNTNPSLNPCDQPEPPEALGAVPCASGVACNQMDGNIAADESGNATDGSTILVQSNGDALLHRFYARNNTGGHFINAVSGEDGGGAPYATSVDIRNGVIADNGDTAAVIITSEGSNSFVNIDSTTISNNTDGTDSFLMHLAGTVALTNSIIDQPGSLTLDYQGSNLTLADLLSNDLSTLTTGTQIAQGAPTFVNAPQGDYHLARTSKGVDFAPAAGGVDLDGNPRDVDLPDVPNQFGPRDLGAYEIQPGCSVGDTIFCDGFDG